MSKVIKNSFRTQQNTAGCVRLLLSLLLCIVVSGCGFQLRGAYSVPESLQTVYLDGENSNSAILKNVKRAMLTSGVTLVKKENSAPHTLYLSDERSEKRSISIDSLAATAEFQIRQFVSYDLRDSKGKVLVGPYELIRERNFQNDINNVVGKRDEERLIREEMNIQLSSQIMRRYMAISDEELLNNALKEKKKRKKRKKRSSKSS